jgi:hypothetical protein
MFGPLDLKINELRKDTQSMMKWLNSTAQEYKDSMNTADLNMCKEVAQKLKEVQDLLSKFPG